LEFYDTGELKIKCNYIGGKLHGEFLNFHKNGKINKKNNYIDGRLNDECLQWCSKEGRLI
jgi:antitoxin component YwqK of YwqJK toxin-antitoxin module